MTPTPSQDATERARLLLVEGWCPYCDAGPFKVPALHVNKTHGMSTRELHAEMGLPMSAALCPVETSEERRIITKIGIEAGPIALGLELGRATHFQRLAEIRAALPQGPKLAPDDDRHGTSNGYSNYMCRCDRCKTAWAETVRRLKANRYEQTKSNGGVAPTDTHNEHTYRNWGCRCGECTSAERNRSRTLRRPRVRPECSVDDCTWPHVAKGLCQFHYQQARLASASTDACG